MHFIRRTAFRAVVSPSTSFISKPRSITTSSPFTLRPRTQNAIPSTVFRRFASDEANSSESKSSLESADSDDRGTIRSAIDSATETVATYASDAAESLTNNAEQAKDAVVDSAASLGFAPRGGDTYSSSRFEDRKLSFARTTRTELRKPLELVPSPSIYVGNLLFDITAQDLEREFAEYGNIRSTVVAIDARGLSKGFGYVEFETTAQATSAIEAKHQTVLEGRRLVVNYQNTTKRESKINPPSKTLFIGNLAFEMSDADLNKLFRDIRNVIDVRVAIDRRTGQPRGFAHADFVDVDSATQGKTLLEGKEVYGRKLRVDYSTGGYANRSAEAPAQD